MSTPLLDGITVIQFFCGQRVQNPPSSQKNVSTTWRKLCCAKEGVPIGRKVPKWQNKHCWWRLIRLS